MNDRTIEAPAATGRGGLGLRLRIMLIFALHAACVGTLFSRVAELQQARGLSEGTFGLVLTGLPCGVFLGSLGVPRLIERHGTRRVMAVGFSGFCAMPALIALAPGAAGFWAGLVGFGLFLALANVPINVEADRVALATGQPTMLKCHGSWGLGFLAVTAAGALAIRAGVPPVAQFLLLAAGVWLAVALLILPLAECPPRGHSRTGPPPRFSLPDRTTFAIMGFSLAGVIFEGVTRQWSVIYLRDTQGAAGWIAALTLPAIMLTQTAGRFLGDRVIARFGERAMGRGLAVLMLAGGALLVWGADIATALAGCLLIGLGISVVHPLAAMAVARAPQRPAAESVAAFATLQTLVGFTAPVLFGLIAGSAGLQVAFAALLPLPALAWICARFLRPRDG
jgi:fucose permease